MLDFSHIQARIEKPTTKVTNERAEQIEKFVVRINNSRMAGGYKPYTASYIASKMSHIKTEDLHAHYQMLDNSKNFSALWHWYNVPKKKPVDKFISSNT